MAGTMRLVAQQTPGSCEVLAYRGANPLKIDDVSSRSCSVPSAP